MDQQDWPEMRGESGITPGKREGPRKAKVGEQGIRKLELEIGTSPGKPMVAIEEEPNEQKEQTVQHGRKLEAGTILV